MSDEVSNVEVRGNIATQGTVSTSGTREGFTSSGAMDGNRFDCGGHAWAGSEKQGQEWWWQITFAEEVQVGKVFMVCGNKGDDNEAQNTPYTYLWQFSRNGETWHSIDGSSVTGEKRIFRIINFATPVKAKYLRLSIKETTNAYPIVREIEMYRNPADYVNTPTWYYASLGGRKCFQQIFSSFKEWTGIQQQYIPIGELCEKILQPEPQPLCVILGGLGKEWCQVNVREYAGLAEVIKNGNIPVWGSCGGMQVILMLEEYGPLPHWDCPHCRKGGGINPIYGHTGCPEKFQCKEYYYKDHVIESGGQHFKIAQTKKDPIFKGTDDMFSVPESHIGHINYAPPGWDIIGVGGPSSFARNQFFRKQNRYIYVSQFHPEYANKEAGKDLLANFLALAKEWGGYNPYGKDISPSADISPAQLSWLTKGPSTPVTKQGLKLLEFYEDLTGNEGFGSLLFDLDGHLVVDQDHFTWLYTNPFMEGKWKTSCRRYNLDTSKTGLSQVCLDCAPEEKWSVAHLVLRIREGLYIAFYTGHDGVGRIRAAKGDHPAGPFTRIPDFEHLSPRGTGTHVEINCGWIKEEESAAVVTGWILYNDTWSANRMIWCKVAIDKETGTVRDLGRHPGGLIDSLAYSPHAFCCNGGNIDSRVRVNDRHIMVYTGSQGTPDRMHIGVALSKDPHFYNVDYFLPFEPMRGRERFPEKFQMYLWKEKLHIISESLLREGPEMANWGTSLRVYAWPLVWQEESEEGK